MSTIMVTPFTPTTVMAVVRFLAVAALLLAHHACHGFHSAARRFPRSLPRRLCSISEKNTGVEDALDEFHRTLGASPFDAMRAARLHLDVVLQLVRSDVQDRESDDGSEVHLFPPTYWAAIEYVSTTVAMMKDSGHPLHAAANMVAKKEGLPQVSRTVRTAMNARRLMSAREIVEVKRKVERTLSQLMTLSIGYRSCVAGGEEKDFVYFAKALLEKAPNHDRHFALLLFVRGIFAPPYAARRPPASASASASAAWVSGVPAGVATAAGLSAGVGGSGMRQLGASFREVCLCQVVVDIATAPLFTSSHRSLPLPLCAAGHGGAACGAAERHRAGPLPLRPRGRARTRRGAAPPTSI
jgi:hypothetical protein